MNPLKRARSEAPLDPTPAYLDVRRAFANSYLLGDGLEIGALHQPLPVPPHAHVRYVDRMLTPDLRREYPELADWDLTEVAVVDDGERLLTIADESQDFIVANHFLEHCENPIGTIETHLSKLKPGGVLFYAVPDKRYTFDFRRPLTPVEHMVGDYEDGPEGSRAGHYREWAELVTEAPTAVKREAPKTDEEIDARARELEAAKYSIHMHVWTQAEFLEMILTCRRSFGESFDIEAAARTGIEFVVVLRKAGAFPVPPAPPPPPANPGPPPTPPGELELWKGRARKAWTLVRNDIRRWRARS
ncbi:MAG TPA: methyltransferase domain-containing protein [Solirubrobacterales bacterium]|nr:methyltransferase domain-containing protein [Solirubrobacterales bacterium]